MRVRQKSVDGLHKSSRLRRTDFGFLNGLKWYWQRVRWWLSLKWPDWQSESVRWEEKGINFWQHWWSGISRTHEDFGLLLARLGEVLKDSSISVSEKFIVLINGFKTSILNPQGRFRAVAGFVLVIFFSSLMSAGAMSYMSVLWGLSEGFARAAESGMTHVKSGIDSLKNEDFSQASFNFAQADQNFSEIKRNLDNFGQGDSFLDGTMAGEEYDNVINLVNGLQSMARGAKFMTAAVEDIENYAGKDLTKVFFGIINGEQNEIFTVIDQAGDYLSMSNSEIQQAMMYFNNIDEDLIPAEYLVLYQQSIKDADRYLNILNGVNAVFTNADNLLGRHYPAKYLLLFQNNNEIRPTGGFIGSYGIATFSQGVMTDLFFDDVYNPDGQILEQIDPPYPVNLMTDQWGIRDSNWDPDFVDSAQRAALFYEKSGGQTVDGVVAFTPEIVHRFLDLTGPIELTDFSVVLTGDNFQDEIQREIEIDATGESQPKKILAELLPVLLERMADLPEESKGELWQELIDLMYEKQILIYMNNEQIEDLFSEIGWTGEMLEPVKNSDFLALIHANIGGRKSDGYMTELINHHVEISPEGEIMVEIEITRKNADDWSKFNHANFDYLRVYVPVGSELLAVDGFANQDGIYRDENNAIWFNDEAGEATLSSTNVYEEYGRTVFANWIVTNPWDVSVVKYRYRLPFKVGDWFAQEGNYKLYVQKQSGRNQVDYNFSLQTDEWQLINTQGEPAGNLWSEENDLLTDWQTEFNLTKVW